MSNSDEKAPDYANYILPKGFYYVPPAAFRKEEMPESFFLDKADPFDFYHFRITNICAVQRTPFQTVAIVDTASFGRALFVDGAIQSAADDEALYHEFLVQPAMLLHPNPKDVLIIGGGEGATLREVLAHHTVRSATMVDIDFQAVELCREHLIRWHRGAFDDPRAKLRYDDGRHFLENDSSLYDVIIIDVVDMLDNGPAQSLYTLEFYRTVRQSLRPGGILAVQGLEFSHLDYKQHAALARTIRQVFPDVHSYRAAIPSFLSSWGFLIAGEDIEPTRFTAQALQSRIETRLGEEWLDHLTGEVILSAFVLCRETKIMLSLPGPILRDGLVFADPPDVDEVDPYSAIFPARSA
ncbi:spermidine synthase [Rhizobium aquaticum]|uniref:Polyamine aminopropyltransferase n=1 Tax=Rhizobium aquaticum TaxID=1549636 RepID=A0ABV2J259_9HYPH